MPTRDGQRSISGGGGAPDNPVILEDGVASTSVVGATSGLLIAEAAGSGGSEEVRLGATGLVSGFVDTAAGVALVASDGDGSFASGSANGSGSTVIASALGSQAHGAANAGGDITATGAGAFANGYTYGSIVASGLGAFAGGASSPFAGTQSIVASSKGGFAHGYVRENGLITASGVGLGAFAHGSTRGGTIQATQKGAHAGGYVQDGLISAEHTAAFARGSCSGNGIIKASGPPSFVNGRCHAGRLYATTVGSFASGYVSGNNLTKLTSEGIGSTAFGRAYGGSSVITSSGNGSFATGNAFNAGVITASGDGSFAAGHTNNAGSITAVADGAFAFGAADTAAITASAANSTQFGPGTNNVANSLQVGGGWQARAGGAFGGAKQSATLGAAATTLAITSNVIQVTGDTGGNTLSTITGGFDGQVIKLLFVDAKVTITDTDAHTANTVDLESPFVSADDATLTLVFDGTSWYEIARSELNIGGFSSTFMDQIGGTPETVTVTNNGTYYPVTQLADGETPLGASTTSGVTTITRPGLYLVSAGASFSGPTLALVNFCVTRDDTRIPRLAFKRDLAATPLVGDGACKPALIRVAANEEFELKVTSDGDGDAITIYHASLTFIKVGV